MKRSFFSWNKKRKMFLKKQNVCEIYFSSAHEHSECDSSVRSASHQPRSFSTFPPYFLSDLMTHSSFVIDSLPSSSRLLFDPLSVPFHPNVTYEHRTRGEQHDVPFSSEDSCEATRRSTLQCAALWLDDSWGPADRQATLCDDIIGVLRPHGPRDQIVLFIFIIMTERLRQSLSSVLKQRDDLSFWVHL